MITDNTSTQKNRIAPTNCPENTFSESRVQLSAPLFVRTVAVLCLRIAETVDSLNLRGGR
jgi:hypothetical protein